MNWTPEQLAETWQHNAVEQSQIVIRRDIREIKACLILMQDALDNAIPQIAARLLETGAPSICPEFDT